MQSEDICGKNSQIFFINKKTVNISSILKVILYSSCNIAIKLPVIWYSSCYTAIKLFTANSRFFFIKNAMMGAT